jgi:YmgG-like glycine-zipper protein
VRRWTAALLTCALLPAGEVAALEEPVATPAIEAPADTAPDHPLKSWLRAQPRSRKRAFLGAITGAVVGYARARVLGHDPVKEAVAGAVAGGIAGYLIGRREDTLHGSRDEAVERLRYEPAQGYVLSVEEVRFDPPRIAPGGTAHVFVRYLVVGPDQAEDLIVRAFTGVKYDGKYMTGIGPDTLVVPRGGGIVETRSTITIPNEAPTGSYSIEALFEDDHGRFQSSREQALYVG